MPEESPDIFNIHQNAKNYLIIISVLFKLFLAWLFRRGVFIDPQHDRPCPQTEFVIQEAASFQSQRLQLQ